VVVDNNSLCSDVVFVASVAACVFVVHKSSIIVAVTWLQVHY